jgi:flagellar FliJ protein
MNPDTINLLQELLGKEKEKAITKLNTALEAKNQSEKQLISLIEQEASYNHLLNTKLQIGINNAEYLNYQHFLTNFQNTISHQRSVFLQNETVVINAQNILNKLHQKNMTYDILHAYNQKKQNIISNKQEQKLNDEFSLRKFFKNFLENQS